MIDPEETAAADRPESDANPAMLDTMIVTIDGPAGSGKSTAARGLAQRLGFCFLDTGAMYRAVTWHCQQQGIDLTAENAVAEECRGLDIRLQGSHVFVNGLDVTHDIRATPVTLGTRFVAANTAVRSILSELQRRAAEGINVVTEGRDQGTTVFPDAECKFFLTADPRQRALRRQRELQERGEQVSIEEILEQQTDRDRRDELRHVGPLKPADDAIHIDTSNLDHHGVLEKLERIVRAKMRAQGT
jgi:cytidylate kinase